MKSWSLLDYSRFRFRLPLFLKGSFYLVLFRIVSKLKILRTRMLGCFVFHIRERVMWFKGKNFSSTSILTSYNQRISRTNFCFIHHTASSRCVDSWKVVIDENCTLKCVVNKKKEILFQKILSKMCATIRKIILSYQ